MTITKIKWYNSKIAQGIGAILLLITTTGGGAFFGKSSGDKGGHLQPYIDSHSREIKEKEGRYTAILNNYNTQITNLKEDIEKLESIVKGNNEYILREQGANGVISSSHNKWKDEIHGSITYKRNLENGKLYYVASNGNKYLVKYMSDKYQFSYGTKEGIVQYWYCEYDNSNPGIIFYNVDKGNFKWW